MRIVEICSLRASACFKIAYLASSLALITPYTEPITAAEATTQPAGPVINVINPPTAVITGPAEAAKTPKITIPCFMPSESSEKDCINGLTACIPELIIGNKSEPILRPRAAASFLNNCSCAAEVCICLPKAVDVDPVALAICSRSPV